MSGRRRVNGSNRCSAMVVRRSSRENRDRLVRPSGITSGTAAKQDGRILAIKQRQIAYFLLGMDAVQLIEELIDSGEAETRSRIQTFDGAENTLAVKQSTNYGQVFGEIRWKVAAPVVECDRSSVSAVLGASIMVALVVRLHRLYRRVVQDCQMRDFQRCWLQAARRTLWNWNVESGVADRVPMWAFNGGHPRGGRMNTGAPGTVY